MLLPCNGPIHTNHTRAKPTPNVEPSFQKKPLLCGTLIDQITQEIRRSPDRRISFARFMQRSLYHPHYGYYSSGKVNITHITSGGHFITHPEDFYPRYSYGLAENLLWMWQTMGRPAKFDVVEMGAGNGRMAKAFLDYSRIYTPEFYKAVDYQIVEISPFLRLKQTQICSDHNVKHINGSAINPNIKGIRGVLLSNELIDAFPVHRIIYHSNLNLVKELYVTEGDGTFHLVGGGISDPEILDYLQMIDSCPPNGTKRIVNLNMLRWLDRCVAALEEGYILTMDYSSTFAFPGQELRCYGIEGNGPLAWGCKYPGEVDITSDLHYDVLLKAAERRGLQQVFFGTEQDFFAPIGALWPKNIIPFAAFLFSKNVLSSTKTNPTKLIILDKKPIFEMGWFFLPIAEKLFSYYGRAVFSLENSDCESLEELACKIAFIFQRESGVYDFSKERLEHFKNVVKWVEIDDLIMGELFLLFEEGLEGIKTGQRSKGSFFHIEEVRPEFLRSYLGDNFRDALFNEDENEKKKRVEKLISKGNVAALIRLFAEDSSFYYKTPFCLTDANLSKMFDLVVNAVVDSLLTFDDKERSQVYPGLEYETYFIILDKFLIAAKAKAGSLLLSKFRSLPRQRKLDIIKHTKKFGWIEEVVQRNSWILAIDLLACF